MEKKKKTRSMMGVVLDMVERVFVAFLREILLASLVKIPRHLPLVAVVVVAAAAVVVVYALAILL